jgi:hypothetical protein
VPPVTVTEQFWPLGLAVATPVSGIVGAVTAMSGSSIA